MTLSEQGAHFICRFEGFKPKPYKDATGIWTIGYGTTYYPDDKKVQETDPAIDQDLARNYLQHHVNKSVSPSINGLSVSLSQPQFDALASFIYNIGMRNFKTSSLLDAVKKGAPHDIITADFAMWNKAKGKVLPGLIIRRAAEAELFCIGKY